MSPALPDRTPAEMARVERLANALLIVLHDEWDDEQEADGPLHPADFVEAALAAVATLGAQHVCPAADLEKAVADHSELFTEAFSMALYASIRGQMSS